MNNMQQKSLYNFNPYKFSGKLAFIPFSSFRTSQYKNIFLGSWWVGDGKYFSFSFLIVSARPQRHAEFKKLL